MSSAYGQVAELAALVASEGQATPQASEVFVLALLGEPNSRYALHSEIVALVAATKDKVVAQVPETVMLVAYNTGGTERFNSRSWGFTFDGHQFYVLHLGVEGTFVYDATTDQWSEWHTEGYDTWNMEHGVEWNDQVFAFDNTLPTLWRLDPTSHLDDDFRPITRVVTGGLPAVAREVLKTGMFVLATSPQEEYADDDTPTVKLSYSDDGGKTFTDRETLTVDGSETQDLSWRSMGSIKTPGRIYKVTDEGGLVRIDGANQVVVGENDSKNDKK